MDLKGQGSHELDASAIHLLHRAGQCAGDLFAAEVKRGGLTPRQFAVLVAISLDEGVSQTELVNRTGIDRSTLADIVRRMLRKGLIARRRTRADARVYSVRLTDAGRSALRDAKPAAEQAESRLLSALEPERRAEFMETLSRIVHSMECCGRREDA